MDRHSGVVISENTHPRSRRTRIALAGVASLALAGSGLAMASSAQAAPAAHAGAAIAGKATAVAGSHPDWAAASADQGAAAASAEYDATVYLAGQDPAGLTAYAQAVSDPQNAAYGHYLTPAQFSARYGATQAQIKAVTSWLTGAGLTVTGTTQHAITVKGSNAAVAKAFGQKVHQYRVSGKTVHAPAADLVVPASVSGAVLGVTGLSSTTPTAAKQPQSMRVSNAPGAAGHVSKADSSLPTVATCSAYWGQKTAFGAPAGYTKVTSFDQCSFVPSQLRKAYGIDSTGLTGKGATIAIVDAYGSSTMLSDANTYATSHGDKAFRKGQYTEYVTPDQWNNEDACGGPDDWQGEESLDVEMAHGLAPDANVVYVGANSCEDNDLLAALSTIVDKHLADVVSNSWAGIMHSTQGDEDPTTIAAYEQVFKQGATEGIGFDFSAGDCGDDDPTAALTGPNCDPTTTEAQTEYPSSDPWVTDVGGTALGISNSKGSYGFETDMGTHRTPLSADGKSWTTWPPPFYFGGGGGTSQDFTQPWYQIGTVPNSQSHTLLTGAHSKTAQRVTPDVAMNGDLYTSVDVGMTTDGVYSEGGYGGTSVSAPEFSAVQADAIQANHGRAIGFANPELYARGGLLTDVVDQRAAHNQLPLTSVFDYGIISGSLDVRYVTFGQDTSLNAVRGYDDATGLGSPNAAYLNSFRFFG